jgi:hypothetical protein
VVDAAGREVEPVSRYLRDLQLGDVSTLTCRSCGHDLLRWFRLLWAVDVGREQATEAEVAALVGWLRSAPNPQRNRRREVGYPAGSVNPKTGKPVPSAGYAVATIAHNLSVVHSYYAFHLHFGRGPSVNPVPESKARRAELAHRSPLEPSRPHRRARLRPKVPARQPQAIPDQQWEDLFSQMCCTRVLATSHRRLRRPCLIAGQPPRLPGGAAHIVPPASPELAACPGLCPGPSAQGRAEANSGRRANGGCRGNEGGDATTGARRVRLGRPPYAALRRPGLPERQPKAKEPQQARQAAHGRAAPPRSPRSPRPHR